METGVLLGGHPYPGQKGVKPRRCQILGTPIYPTLYELERSTLAQYHTLGGTCR